jgi:hypothetical protein
MANENETMGTSLIKGALGLAILAGIYFGYEHISAADSAKFAKQQAAEQAERNAAYAAKEAAAKHAKLETAWERCAGTTEGCSAKPRLVSCPSDSIVGAAGQKLGYCSIEVR